MTKEEIILRRLVNQHLVTPGEKSKVAQALCGVQAQFSANARHALAIRSHDDGAFEAGLVKSWTLRGTMHLFAQEDIALFLRCGADYRRNQWDAPSWWNQRPDWALTPQQQAYLSQVILEELKTGPKTREELKQLCRRAGMTAAEEASLFHPWGGGIRQLCERGFIHYTAEEWKTLCLTPEGRPMAEAAAELELARRYFTYYGPATVHDCQYFFRATAKLVQTWLAQLPVCSAQCQGKTYYYIENGNTYAVPMPECLFLAGFDPLMLGYEKKESLFFSQAHLRRIFSLAGIVLPTIVLHGTAVGTWKMKNRKLEITLFEPLSQAERALIFAKAEQLWPDMTNCEWK